MTSSISEHNGEGIDVGGVPRIFDFYLEAVCNWSYFLHRHLLASLQAVA